MIETPADGGVPVGAAVNGPAPDVATQQLLAAILGLAPEVAERIRGVASPRRAAVGQVGPVKDYGAD